MGFLWHRRAQRGVFERRRVAAGRAGGKTLLILWKLGRGSGPLRTDLRAALWFRPARELKAIACSGNVLGQGFDHALEGKSQAALKNADPLRIAARGKNLDSHGIVPHQYIAGHQGWTWHGDDNIQTLLPDEVAWQILDVDPIDRRGLLGIGGSDNMGHDPRPLRRKARHGDSLMNAWGRKFQIELQAAFGGRRGLVSDLIPIGLSQ